MSKSIIRSAASLAAFALASASAVPAFAQDTGTTAPQSADEEAAPSGPDIIVTAQGRSQQLADVPVAISAVNSETLKNSGANDIRQLNQVAPSLLVSSTGSEANGSARIRGIGTVGDNPGLESSVPVFIDGVYRSRSGIGLNELGELDRIEVQRGPQGTLGGRNSSAGLISIFSKKPQFQLGGTGELTYGNYDYMRGAISVTGPLSETIAARFDGVYVKRDGFNPDPANNTEINNRNRYFVRGQLLFEPSDALSVRLIGDYTHRKERCCSATYVDASVNPFIGDLNNLSTPLTPLQMNGNNIVNVLRDLGQPLAGLTPGRNRTAYVTPGRSFSGKTTDYGGSAQIDYDFGGAKLTSITAYREYRSGQAGDVDYNVVDILFRAPSDDLYRQFHTFTQELRLQGEAFDGKLDWLVGGFYADERLTVQDNLKFGSQYGRFANCRIVSGGGLAFAYSPGSQSCITPALRPNVSGAFGAAGPLILAGLDRLDTLNNLGSTIDQYTQKDRNYALFTHNIFHITDALSLTLGVRYTNDKKKFGATFGNNNTVCTANQAALLPLLAGPLAGTAGAIIGLSCQGNSTAELNGVTIRDTRSEDEFTGTGILSWKATDDLLLYTSYSRGYKAGGFNLDRSALKSPTLPFANTPGGAQALVGNLQFDPEKVTAYEVGAKYSTGPFSASVAVFRSEFRNFQLNTFNGTVFLVQTINGCNASLGITDSDQNQSALAPNFNAAPATTGRCAPGDVSYGVRAQGVELETSIAPARNFRVGLGLTYAKTAYRSDLVGSKTGLPLDPALRRLPGRKLSNAPQYVATSSVTWTPDLGSSGLTGLLYVDGRMSSDYNTGSDLFPQKGQDGFATFNARVGVRGPDETWSVEFWGQNIFQKKYSQVAFNTPFQAGTTSAPFLDPQYPGGRQLISQFIAEPRTYGITLRGKF